jgi:hypothetical protein
VTTERAQAGDVIALDGEVIQVHVAELRQLFNGIDPSSFRDKDLDPAAEEFIVGWSKDAPRDAPLALLVHLDRPAGPPDEAVLLRDAIHEFFTVRAQRSRRQLRHLFQRGRISLLIALAFLGASIAIGDLLAAWMDGSHLGDIAREGLLIGGWVAMWRPLDVFLYDWWPIRAEARLSDRLASMPVGIRYGATSVSDAWRHDWPALPVHAANVTGPAIGRTRDQSTTSMHGASLQPRNRP